MKLKMCLFILLILSLNLQAQNIQPDSASIKTKLASSNVKKFKLDHDKWLAYKQHQIPITSDYFKPTVTNVGNPALLTDSVYVKAYRNAAAKKTFKRRSVGHYILVGAGIYVVAIGVSTIVLIIIFASS